MEEKDLKKYFGYKIMDDQVKDIIDNIREKYPKYFEGYLPASRRGYRWKIRWGQTRRIYIKKENNIWLSIPLQVILGKQQMDEILFLIQKEDV